MLWRRVDFPQLLSALSTFKPGPKRVAYSARPSEVFNWSRIATNSRVIATYPSLRCLGYSPKSVPHAGLGDASQSGERLLLLLEDCVRCVPKISHEHLTDVRQGHPASAGLANKP